MDYILIIAWFALLIKWADYMVQWASNLAKAFWVSNLVIWLTVVAFWTSAPELVTSLISAINWNPDLAISNVIWSNISNLLLILWITALFYPIKAPKDTFQKEIPFMLAATILFALLVLYEPEKTITRPDAGVLIMFFSIFLYYIFKQATKNKKLSKELKKSEKKTEKSTTNLSKSWMYTIWGLAWLVLWGKLIVSWAVSIAESFWIPNAFIWITIVAIGTSLPELASSIMAAMKKNTDMAIGWIIWSNIFNSLWILWATGLIAPLQAYEWVTLDAYFNIFVVFVLIIVLFSVKWKYKISKPEGFLLLSIYIAYIWYLTYNLFAGNPAVA